MALAPSSFDPPDGPTPRLLRLVEDALQRAPVESALEDLASVARFDRYQASDGAAAAAGVVAAAARRIGLREVAIRDFPADGVAHFWSFRSPVSWTPRRARFTVTRRAGAALRFDHDDQPFLIAAYSAAPPGARWAGRLAPYREGGEAAANAVALVDREAYARADWPRALRRVGARGFITDGPCRVDDAGREVSGRIELDPDTSLFGFSVTHQQFAAIAAAAQRGGGIEVELEVDRAARMRVVTALLPGAPGAELLPEIWMTAHLCHPRPGANDNASGVAALLGVAETLRRLAGSGRLDTRRRTVRFVWAPEYVGAAAFLRAEVARRGLSAWPEAVINLDMVAGDPAKCGATFVVERPPDTIASPLTVIAEEVVDLVFAATGSGREAWRPVSFLGYSDQALFAGPGPSCPAILLSQWPDRFNHSGADSLDKISPLQMRRSVAAATVIAALAARDYDSLDGEWPVLLRRWLDRDRAQTRWVADAAPPSWATGLFRHVETYHHRVRASWPARRAEAARKGDGPTQDGWAANWEGPANVRAMLARLPEDGRREIEQAIRGDKRALAYLIQLAVRADGARTLDCLRQEASWALRWPLDEGLAGRLLAAWVDTGMFVPTSRQYRAPNGSPG